MKAIIDAKVRELVTRIEATTASAAIDAYLKEIVLQLEANLEGQGVPDQRAHHQDPWQFQSYPLDNDGFARSFDPLTEEEELLDCWHKYGVVVGREAISQETASYALQRIGAFLDHLSDGKFRFDNPRTYQELNKDTEHIPCLTRGFLEVYHDHSFAMLRQALRVYLQHVLIHRTTKLWTSFDRYGVKIQHACNSQALPLHVDQNPLVHPHFKTTQGMIALLDTPLASGCFAIMPASNKVFDHYVGAVKQLDPSYRGEYVEASWLPELEKKLKPYAVPIPLRARDMVTWDSRSTHGSFPLKTMSPRIVAFVSAGPARTDDDALLQTRLQAVQTGVGKNVREALMHASKPPRFANAEKVNAFKVAEKLDYLGRMLYGMEAP